MTYHTFKTVKLILDKCFAVFCNFLVASLAGHFYVFSVQFELCFIVVKLVHLPGIKTVAPGTIGHTKLFKLPVVIIFMAT